MAAFSPPEGLCLGRRYMQAHDFAFAIGVCGHSDYGGDTDDAPALALLKVGGIQPEIRPFAAQRPSRKACTRSSISAQSLLTVLLLMPSRPIATTRSSTRRVETPPIYASWITATRAFSLVLRPPGTAGSNCPGAVWGYAGAARRGGHPGCGRGSRCDR